MNDKPGGRILLSTSGFRPQLWYDLLSAERPVVMEPEAGDQTIEYAVVWKQPPGLLARLPNLKAIFSIGAGVDHIFADPDLPDVPIVRVVADNLTQHMVEYVVWRVLDHHRQGAFYRTQQARKLWRESRQPLTTSVSVGIMGFGQLGRASAKALLPLGFQINGWTRTERRMDGVTTWHGEEGLVPFLNATDILVVLLPYTPATEGVVNYDLLGKLRRDGALGGPCLINAGRGKLQRGADILRALDEGILKEASLDVFEEEPLSPDSPFWTHPKVFVTPHAAATSDPHHLVPLMLEQMAAYERGEPLKNLVNLQEGY